MKYFAPSKNHSYKILNNDTGADKAVFRRNTAFGGHIIRTAGLNLGIKTSFKKINLDYRAKNS